MIKKTIAYTDFDGNERKEDFYFNLTKAEVIEMELSTQGGLIKAVEKIIAEQDSKKIVEILKDIVLKSYGEKSPDGRRFIKTKELREAFVQTEAYSELIVEMFSDADTSAAFMNGIIPNVPAQNQASPALPGFRK